MVVTRRFHDRASPPLPATSQIAAHIKYDGRLERWRWAFDVPLEQARARLGRDPSPQEAAAALAPELQLAAIHIDSQPPDDSVFGVVHESPAMSVAVPVDPAKAADSRRRAEATFQMAMAPKIEDWQRQGFAAGAVEILYDHLRDLDPNDLSAGCSLARYLHWAKRPLDGLAEWADVYCRAASAARLLRMVTRSDDPTRARIESAYSAFLTGAFVAELHSTSAVVGAQELLEMNRLGDLPARDTASLQQWARYVEIHLVNWLVMVSACEMAMSYFQLGPGTLHGARRDIRTLFKLFRESHLPVYPQPMKDVLLKCLGAIEPLLSKPIPSALRPREIRVAACQALGEIALFETIDVLDRHRQHPEPVVRKAVEQAIIEVGKTLSFQG